MESFALKPSSRQKSVHHEVELAGCSALIADSDNTSRSVLAKQLRDFGFNEIAQHSKIQLARDMLELKHFDVVLCAQYFGPDSPTGQDLLDDLRRDSLLPFSTVFIMVTAESSYAKVEQAAESALDGYLLKPHSAAGLVQRLLAARRRKLELADIFEAIENQHSEKAIALCQQRFDERGTYWLYAARLGAELLLRAGKFAQARSLYQAVAKIDGEPWARAGVARALLSEGQFAKATTLLQELTQQVPGFVDGFDVLGRAQLKLGQLDQAMESYRAASTLTPSSIARLQRIGMLAYYLGDATEAEHMLDQAMRLGQDSRSFDFQTIALLALLRAVQNNVPGVVRCRDVARALTRKMPDNVRLARFALMVEGITALRKNADGDALAAAQDLCDAATAADFDFDLASNLLGFLSLLEFEGLHFGAASDAVKIIGNRYCTSDATFALLQAASKLHEAYAKLIQQCNEQLLELSEQAMKRHLEGDHGAAIESFMELASTHLNARVFETAQQLFQRHTSSVKDAPKMERELQALRERAGVSRARPGFADSQGRPPAGVALRISSPLPEAAGNW